MGLGSYPVLTLCDGRAQALENYRAIRKGTDSRRRKPGTPRTPTGRALAEEIIDRRQLAPLTRKDWCYNLNVHASAILDKPVDRPTTRVANDLLAPIWLTKPTIAGRVHQRLKTVMDVAIARG